MLYFVVCRLADRRDLPSFPTRRSSDLDRLNAMCNDKERPVQFVFAGKAHPKDEPGKRFIQMVARDRKSTPELQSRFDLVCRLLLEKKNRKHTGDLAVYHLHDTPDTPHP